jgi:MoaA/NifB/PqqE/SkfB family radical SAM enzyme
MSSQFIANRSEQHLDQLNQKLRESGLPPVDAKTFCILPFVHMSTTTIGELKLCCRSEAVANISSENLSDVWQSSKLQEVRADLINGVRRKECKACWKLEDLGMISLRMGQNIMRSEVNTERIMSWVRSKEVQPLQNIELKLSNICNLKCRMCSPIASTPWMRDWEKVADIYSEGDARDINESFAWQKKKREPVLDFFMHNENFLRDFEKIAESIEELEFAGGEPLLDGLHYEVLKRVESRAQEITLKYSTNLMVLGTAKYKALEVWPKFKQVKLTVSVDGPAQLNEYIRTGTQSEIFEKNLQLVRQLGNVTLKASTCVSAYNAPFLADTLRYVSQLGMSWYSNRVSSPRFLDARILPHSIRDKIVAELRQFTHEDLERMGYTSTQATMSLRTAHDCASWLEDSSLDSQASGEFNKLTDYIRRLDAIRKTDYSEFFHGQSENRALFAAPEAH